ncbi:hypothetical protein [Methanobrevibacter filiformis]|uniref:Uncharacterized protein n=1 Tax=Methanobrevibacter filiformis TaxID=55758 RepID=A0A166A6K3_9EURY|nr:hypothetical protein [Methanobrevibacter filiformis]KZX11638.1 hypothetical protein MBFIL_13610 [Methanobrevibacter filiformis]
MAKIGLKIIIAIVLFVVAFFAWSYLHLYLIDLLGIDMALISFPIITVIYILLLISIFKIIDPNESNNGNISQNHLNTTNQNYSNELTPSHYSEKSTMGQNYHKDNEFHQYLDNENKKF